MTTILKFMSVDHDRLDNTFDEFHRLKIDDINRAKTLFLDFKAGLQTHIAKRAAPDYLVGTNGSSPPPLMRVAMLRSLEAAYTTRNLGFRCATDVLDGTP